jgi:SAM-dependent methyltransferase
MSSLSFDRAVSYYDRTRLMPDWLRDALTDSFVREARVTPESKILEIGIGTGRIALQFAERGLFVVGVDLSLAMMGELQKKNAKLGYHVVAAQADANALPFSVLVYDCVYIVNTLHVVANWQNAIHDAWRILKPGGYLLVSAHYTNPESIFDQMQLKLRELAQARGIDARLPGLQSDEELKTELNRLGETRIVEVVRHVDGVTPAPMLDGLGARGASNTWVIPENILDEIMPSLRVWAEQTFGDLSRELEEESRFDWMVVKK